MGYYQVIAIPIVRSSGKPCKPFIDKRLYTEISRAEERLQEIVSLYPHYEVQIVVVSVEDGKE